MIEKHSPVVSVDASPKELYKVTSGRVFYAKELHVYNGTSSPIVVTLCDKDGNDKTVGIPVNAGDTVVFKWEIPIKFETNPYIKSNVTDVGIKAQLFGYEG